MTEVLLDAAQQALACDLNRYQEVMADDAACSEPERSPAAPGLTPGGRS